MFILHIFKNIVALLMSLYIFIIPNYPDEFSNKLTRVYVITVMITYKLVIEK